MGKAASSHGKLELKKGPWTREEDQKLLAYIEEHGHGSWRALPAKAGLERCGKSCRLRWTNYLRPDIKRGKFSSQEEKAIIRLHALLGNRWSAIAAHLPKRTDNEIKNYWNTRLKKRLTRMGIDPVTHKPKTNSTGSAQSRQSAAVVSHMAQWETARLEAEARFVRESKLLSTKLQLVQRFTAAPPVPPPPHPAAPQFLDVLRVWQSSTSTSHNGSCFFGSGSSLESPTSTLNCSAGNIGTVPTVGGSLVEKDDVVTAMDKCKGKMENAADQVLLIENNNNNNNDSDEILDYGYNNDLSGSLMDLVTVNSCDGYNNNNNKMMMMISGNYVVGEFEENKNYWNDLLNLVSSPCMESPVF